MKIRGILHPCMLGFITITLMALLFGTSSASVRALPYGNGAAGGGNLWPCGIVPYYLAPPVFDFQRQQFREAADVWEAQGFIHFIEITDDDTYNWKNYLYVEFVPTSAYESSRPGMAQKGSGGQPVHVHTDSLFGTVHELGHALGLIHEHQRIDRDPWVRIYVDNILDPRTYPQWDVFCGFTSQGDCSAFQSPQSPYDYDSVMHYGAYQGAYCLKHPPCGPGKEVIEVLQQTQFVIGQHDHLSDSDKSGMRVLYPAVCTVSVDPTQSSINVGDTIQYTATVKDGAGFSVTMPDGSSYFPVQWSTDQPPIATVDTSGLAKGEGAGTATISATVANWVSGSATLNVGGGCPTGAFDLKRLRSTAAANCGLPPPTCGSGPCNGNWEWCPDLNEWVWVGDQPTVGCWHSVACAGGGWAPDACPPNGGVGGVGLPVTGITSGDPNDKVGSAGVGVARFVSGAQAKNYSIYFDNMPTATAPAQQIVVTDPLNKSLVDLTTLTLGAVSVGKKIISPPNVPLSILGTYVSNVDLRPDNNIGLRVTASLNQASGVLIWTLSSIDLRTMQPTTDPLAGILPAGTEGSVSFSVRPKSVQTGTQISNQATVVFDTNAPMNTPVWTNTLDNNAPVSRVAALASSMPCPNFKVQWSGSDIGAGTKGYAIYASDNGGAFAPWLTTTSATSSVFRGQVGHSYSFYSIATDLVGNVEPAKNAAEATTTVSSGTSCGPPSLSGAASVVSYVNNTLSLNLQFTNIGASDALNSLVKTLTFRTLGGTETVTLASPSLPFIVGTVSVGNTITIPVTLNVPSTVTRFSMTEGGTMQDSHGKTYSFSIGQNVVP